MGQVISFVKNINTSVSLSDDSLLTSVSKINQLNNAYFVFCLRKIDFKNEFLLNFFLKQIALLNKLDVKFSIVCPVGSYLNEKDGKEEKNITVEENQDSDYLKGYASKINSELSQLGCFSVKLYASDAKISLINEKTKLTSLNNYNDANNYISNSNEEDFMSEIKKTSIVPIIIPLYEDSKSKKILDTFDVGCSIAVNFQNTRIVSSFDIEKFCLQYHICSIDKFLNITKENTSSSNLERMLNIIKHKIEYIHFLDLSKNVNVLNEITFTSSAGVLLYRDKDEI